METRALGASSKFPSNNQLYEQEQRKIFQKELEVLAKSIVNELVAGLDNRTHLR